MTLLGKDLKLTFGRRNQKLDKLAHILGKPIYSLSLLSGYTCPGAHQCLAKAIQTPEGFRIQNGPEQIYRCYSASQEVLYPNVYKARLKNWTLLREAKTRPKMRDLIISSLPPKADIVRLHVGGDFFCQNYFDSWIDVANLQPMRSIYGYTKALAYWVRRLDQMPQNFRLIASYGGRYDDLIEEYGLPSATVVFSQEEAEERGLLLDFTDERAFRGETFGLLVHGTQRKKVVKPQEPSA